MRSGVLGCIVSAFALLAPSGEAFAFYGRVKQGVLACQDRTDWTKLSRLLEDGNPRAIQRFLATRRTDQDCRRFFGSRSVFVQIRSGDVVCLRPMGEMQCLWTAADNLN
jgi:hypothetical protein